MKLPLSSVKASTGWSRSPLRSIGFLQAYKIVLKPGYLLQLKTNTVKTFNVVFSSNKSIEKYDKHVLFVIYVIVERQNGHNQRHGTMRCPAETGSPQATLGCMYLIVKK